MNHPFYGTLFIVVALANPNGFAQIGVHHVSLEAQIVQAESVFCGRIARLESKIIVAPGQRNPNGEVEHSFSVKIKEVIKGEAKDIKLVRKTAAYDKRFEQWFENKTEFLWFVSSGKGNQVPSSKAWDAIRLTDPVLAESFFSNQPPVFSMNLSQLSKADAILDCARRFAKSQVGPVSNYEMRIPTSIGGGDVCSITVPILPALEKNALLMIRSPQELMPERHKINSLDAYVLNLAGVTALQHFKSPGNIELLKTLLNDPTEIHNRAGNNSSKVVYPIREKSFEILREWKVDTPKPRVEKTLNDNQKCC